MWKIRYLLFSIFVGMLYSQALDIKYTIVFVHKDNFIIVCVGELFKILRMRMLTESWLTKWYTGTNKKITVFLISDLNFSFLFGNDFDLLLYSLYLLY